MLAAPQIALYFGLAFPIARNETALTLVPKLPAELTCLSRFANSDFIARYPATYANLAVFMSLLGFVTGYLMLEIVRAMPSETTTANVPLASSQRRVVKPNRTRFLVALLVLGAMLALFWAVAFDWSICLTPSAGISEWKAESGMLSATLLATAGFLLIGVLLRVAIIRMRAGRR